MFFDNVIMLRKGRIFCYCLLFRPARGTFAFHISVVSNHKIFVYGNLSGSINLLIKGFFFFFFGILDWVVTPFFWCFITTLGWCCLNVTSGILCSFSYNLFEDNQMQFIFSEKRSWNEGKKRKNIIYIGQGLSWGKNATLSFVFEVLKSFTNCISLYSVSLLLTSVWYFDNFWSSYGEVMGQLLSKLATVEAPDADSRNEMEKMSRQIQDYEILVKQLKVWPSTEVPPLTVYKWSISVSCINKFRLLVRLSTLGSSLFWTSGFYDSILTHRS